MKKIFSVLLYFTIFYNAGSQQIPYDVKSTELMRDKLSERSYGIQPVGQTGDFVYFLFQPYSAVFNVKSIGSVGNHFIGKYDGDLNLIKKAAIILSEDKKGRQMEGVFILNGELVVFSSLNNPEQKKHQLFAQKINKESLLLEENVKLLGELDYSGINKYKDSYFQYEVSEDRSKILVFYTLLGKGDETLKSGMFLYDSGLKPLWKNEDVSPDLSEGIFRYHSFKIDNKGNVYLLGLHYADRKNYFDDAGFRKNGFFSSDTYYTYKPNYTYQIYRFYDSGTKEEHADITIPFQFIRSLSISPAGNNSVICTGIYSAPGRISADGGFVFNFNIATKQISKLDKKEFGTSLIEAGFNEKELNRFRRNIDNKAEWDPFEYILGDIKTRKNGEKYFVAEQYISGTKTQRSGNMITYSTIFMHNDLFVFNLTADNRIKRIDKVSKRQYLLTTDRFNSYTTLEENGSLYFLFNTIVYNDTMFKNAKMGDTYLVSIDNEGKQNKVIFKPKEMAEKIILMPGTSISFGRNSIIYGLMSATFKDYTFEKLTINAATSQNK
jgi:hypothetical protein